MVIELIDTFLNDDTFRSPLCPVSFALHKVGGCTKKSLVIHIDCLQLLNKSWGRSYNSIRDFR